MTPFLNYPGHVINASLKIGAQAKTVQDISEMFERPFMGGMDRHGIISTGNPEEIRNAVNLACQTVTEDFILGADCTLPGDINWENIKMAIDTAHQHRK